jgi:hypothetical protein
MKQKIAAICLILVLIAFFMLYYYVPFNPRIRGISIDNHEKKQFMKNYLQKKIDMIIPTEYEIYAVVIKHGKDTAIIIGGTLKGDIEKILIFDKEKYKSLPCGVDDQKFVFSLFNNFPDDYLIMSKAQKYIKNAPDLIEIFIVPTDVTGEYYIYFELFDNHFTNKSTITLLTS